MDDFEAGFFSDTEPSKETTPAPQRQAAAPPQQQAPEYRAPAEDLPSDVADFFDDCPEFQKAIEYTTTSLKRELGLNQYIQGICGGAIDDQGQWQDGVRDAIAVVNTPEYQKWYESKGYGVCTAGEGIRRIREFKSQRGGRGSSSHTTRTSSTDTDFERAFYG